MLDKVYYMSFRTRKNNLFFYMEIVFLKKVVKKEHKKHKNRWDTLLLLIRGFGMRSVISLW